MATDIYYFSGTCKWAKVHESTPTYDKKGMEWSISMYLDDNGWAQFEKSGLELKVRTDDDGKFVNFKRPTKKLIKDELVEFESPIVVDANNMPVTKLIGNGSEVIAKVSVYDTTKGKGHRFEGIRVVNLKEVGGTVEHVEDGVVPF